MIIYIGEFIGTIMFVLIGLAMSANAGFGDEEHKITRQIYTSLGWALAYVIPALAFGEVSGPHLNPAITIALSTQELFETRFAAGYIICQVAGALIACLLFYACYFRKINETEEEEQLKMFCVCPEEKNIVLNFVKEFVASFMLMFGILGITQVYGIRTEIIYIFYIAVYTGIGLAFNFAEVACNPIRDVIPRLFYLVMPMKKKGKCNILYVLVTIIAPILGYILAVFLNKILPWDSAISH